MDALRGVAAVAVVFYHFGTRLGAQATVPHGYLAVDFFFMLSGFVLAHAYTQRLPALSATQFALIRAIRLLPMSVLGLAIGTAYFLVRWKVQPAASDSFPQILGASALNFALIPKLWVGGATADEIFPADGVLWSLSFEFFINIIWAAALARLKPVVQGAIVVVAAFAMACLISRFGTANLGWGWHTYLGGIARMVFGFMLGVLLWRLRPAVQRSWKRPLLAVAILVAALSMPTKAWGYDLAVIVLVFPVLLYVAASADFGADNAVVRFLADISYPVYAVHLPLIMAVSGLSKHLSRHGGHPPAVIYAVVAPIILFAWALGRWYESPVRRWLSRHLLGRAGNPPMNKISVDSPALPPASQD